jgi:hypothetical protein
MSRTSSATAVLLGSLAVGVLDILDAFVFFGWRGVSPLRILQSIAAGLLGRAAFDGGLRTAALGLLLHFFIAFVIVLVYYVASGRLSDLVRHPIRYGLLYGVAAYAVMTFVVVPLSAAGGRLPSWPVAANGLFIHTLGVGLPAALAARAARRGESMRYSR